MMELTSVVFISLVFLCGVRDAHADTNLTDLTGQVRVLTASIQAWKGRVDNIKTDMKNHFRTWESSLKNQLTDTFISALINPLVEQAITGILKEYNIRNIMSGHILDVVNRLRVSVQYTKTQLQAVTQQFRRVEKERDSYKESLEKLRSEVNTDIHSLQLQLNETKAGLRDAKMVNTVLREELMTLNTNCVGREEIEARTHDDQSYREGLQEMQQKLKTDIQSLNIQLNQTIDDLHDSNQVITGLAEDIVTLNTSCVMREDIKEVNVTDRSLTTSSLSQVSFTTSPPSFSDVAGASSDPSRTEGTTVTTTRTTGDNSAATPSPADCRDLSVASRRGNLEEVKRLLSRGIDVNCRRGKWSWTPVMPAARWGHSNVVKLLVSKGADVSLVDKDGDNILRLACMGGHLETVEFVLSLNVVDINSRGGGSRTPVMTAAEWRHRDVVELLVSKGADVSLVDVNGDNILHWACWAGHLATVKFVLSLNVVDINSRGGGSRTPVMRAALRRHRDVVELLVSKGADVSLVDEDGDNTLHLACYRGHLETVKFVLSLNVVDIDARNNSGRTAADVARRRGHTPVLDLLVSHGAQ
ncbi:ankyrin repeat and KH domain-containing protein 1-like [Haliotis rufescens]|uniref:ankyrin repeat and KH domain-containing protein 1-like n=1 Tax=Haliotis rufescens TaxID=6454 RepID=UPI00201F6858|nr:ankyrin repeat and KH domain-containing protein 1-like [Haliotis rufescens]